MFAPYCSTCGHAVLLGTRRIVSADLSHPPFALVLRCFCGTNISIGASLPDDAGEPARVAAFRPPPDERQIA